MTKRELPYQSLHTHTVDSDGEATHQQVLEAAEANGFGAVAFTDHDTVLSDERLRQLREYNGPVDWVSGVELSSGLPKEQGGGATNNLHVVGLFVDPTNQDLGEHCRKTHEARQKRMKAVVANLNELGFTITEDDCLEAAGGGSVGRPHIVEAIHKHQTNQRVLEELEARVAEDAKHDEQAKQWYDRYQQIIRERPAQRPFELFLGNDPYFPALVDFEYWQDFDSVVSLIRGAGGIALWAHWWTTPEEVDRDGLADIAEAGRIDGLETSFPLVRDIMDTREETLREVAESCGIPGVTAVDLHALQTFADLAAQSEDAATTTGTVQRLIDATGVSTEWSSLHQ